MNKNILFYPYFLGICTASFIIAILCIAYSPHLFWSIPIITAGLATTLKARSLPLILIITLSFGLGLWRTQATRLPYPSQIETPNHQKQIATNPGEWDPYFQKQTSPPSPFPPSRTIQKIHTYLVEQNQKALPAPYGNLLTSMVLGNQNITLPQTWKALFNANGLTHLLVVSGAQITLLNQCALLLLVNFPLTSLQQWILLGLLNIGFGLLSGGGVSITRAILTTQIALGCRLMGRNTPMFHAISLTLLLLLIYHPWTLLNIGAQLSFIATASLVWGTSFIKKLIPPQIPEWISNSLCVTLSPWLWTTPLLWFHFQTLSWISIIANLLVLPLSEILVIVGFLASLLGIISLQISAIFHHCCWLILRTIEIITTSLSSLPMSNTGWVSPPAWGIALLYLTIASLLVALLKKKYTYALFSLTSIFSLFVLTIYPIKTPPLSVTFLDVGQGDAIVIQTPNRHTYIVDTGNHILNRFTQKTLWDASLKVILPYLHHQGINHINALILTHADMDHVGGAPELIRHIPIDIIFHNGHLNEQLPWLAKIAQEKKIPTQTLKAGDTLNFSKNITGTILNPEANGNPYDKTNNQSVTFILRYHHISFLLSGDLEEERELAIVNGGSPLNVTVLKLGHHGSKTSSCHPFLEKTRPQVAIVSAGRFNHYHHPHFSVIDRVQQLRIKLFRTDQQGAITYLTDGQSLLAIPFLSTKDLKTPSK